MSPNDFVAKWKAVNQTERAVAQAFFLDLCELLEEPKPQDADPSGTWYCFEKGATKTTGSDGWADVWKRGYFAWENKGKHKDLDKAYVQLQQYAVALENPPLLIVCDIERIKIVTNWTNNVSTTYELTLEDLLIPAKRQILKDAFSDPTRLKSASTRGNLTEKVAKQFAELAQELDASGYLPPEIAEFINRMVFCMFAEDTGILGHKLFTEMLEAAWNETGSFADLASTLFGAMQTGGAVGFKKVEWFNGGLFTHPKALPLTKKQIGKVREAAALDWSQIDPSLLGTLFERGLDPDKRGQLGAHYTDPENIMRIIDPVVLQPLREEWELTKAKILAAPQKMKKGIDTGPRLGILNAFLERLRGVKVLDPACGSGNFLYLALRSLKDLEHRVLFEAEAMGLPKLFPELDQRCVHGIEINPYAAELARVTVWIGELQWQLEHGYNVSRNPILKTLDTIENRDALLAPGGSEAEWPDADFIIGNPPFLGGGLLRRGLGHEYVETLFKVYGSRIPNFSDLCCYWFEKAREKIASQETKSAGLIATQGIRGGANRTVLNRITESQTIFSAWKDMEWVLDGANVHVSIVCFSEKGTEIRLDGSVVDKIHSNLEAGESDSTSAKSIRSNEGKSFKGPSPAGPMDITEEVAVDFLLSPNPHGLPNSDVIRPVVSATDISQSSRKLWTIDFQKKTLENAALYDKPFAYVEIHVKPVKELNRRPIYSKLWWQYAEARLALRQKMEGIGRVIVTPGTAKHRVFRWYPVSTLCNQGTFIFTFEDDYTFGVLHSRFHEVWALAQGTQLREKESGFRYTPTTCFETFPFPEPTESLREAIGAAAKELDRLRENWLNPEEWTQENVLEFPATVGGPWHRWIPDAENLTPGSIATTRYVRSVAHPATAKALAKRTLTNLYNERPAWLRHAHEALDNAVADAYGFPHDISDAEILSELLRLNLEIAAREAADVVSP